MLNSQEGLHTLGSVVFKGMTVFGSTPALSVNTFVILTGFKGVFNVATPTGVEIRVSGALVVVPALVVLPLVVLVVVLLALLPLVLPVVEVVVDPALVVL